MRAMEPKLILLVAFATGALAGPIIQRDARDPTSCASQCNDATKFKYAAGSTYEYTYNANTRTTMSGAAEDHAGLGIKADVTIEALTSCEMILTLSGVQVLARPMTSGDNSRDFRRALEANPLRFSFQDGVVEQICPEDDDSAWSLNVKRAMLSAFQNSMADLERDQRVKESDVTGECFTDYRVTQRGRRTSIIKKSKDLLGCENRHGYKTSFHSLPYKMPNAVHSLPLLKSTHDCSQTITSEGILQRSTCSETHVFRPFSKDNNGAMTEASHTLEFRRTQPYVRSQQGLVASRSALTFEHTYGLRDEEVNRRDASTKMQELCRVTATDIRPEVPQMFSELVYILKNSNFRSLQALYRQLKTGQICGKNSRIGKKFFIDAIPMIGSVDAIKMMRELMTAKDVDSNQADMWLTSLAFIQHPTVEMITEIQPLMLTSDSKRTKILVAAMVNNFCVKTAECTKVPVIDLIISILENDIGRGCVVTDKNEEDILLTLRAIGNIGNADRLSLSLQLCFTREKNPMEVRIAALDAFRRLPCGADRNNAMQLYMDGESDAEVRIAAYLVAMQCPVETILTQVRATLEVEKANQVGSFVWSHLMNLQETSSPLKQQIRHILEDEQLSREFDLDKRKFSRNYEGSFFWEKFNAGAMVESNLIFSSKSFVPRSASVNLTVDLFGQSVNLFEMGGRVEGLESVLESFFGADSPTGVGSKKTGYEDSRSVRKEKMDRMKKKYAQVKDDLHAAVFLRIFGNELRYMHFDSSSWPLTKDKFNFLDFLIKMSKDHDYSFANSVMFLDSSIIVPTCAGLPLNLTVHGAATVNMNVKGKLDLRNLATKPTSLLIEGVMQPSGAVEITGTMTVDAFVAKTGLKMVSSVHSSSSVKGRVELSRGQIFNLELDMPQDKMEIFNVKSSFFIVHDKVEKEQKMVQENRKTRRLCSGDRLAKFTGVELCGDISFPNASMITDSPYFPFTGPVSFGLTLSKKDTHSGYKMVVKSISTRDKVFGQLGFDTPGSSVKRAMSLDVAVSYKDKAMEIALVSPWKEASFKSSLVDSVNIKQLKGTLLLDQKDKYGLDTQVRISKKGSEVTYLPTMDLRRLTNTQQILTGSITRDGVQKIDIDLTSNIVTADPVNIKAGYVNTKAEKSVRGSYTYKKDEYNFLARALIASSGKSTTHIVPTLVISMPKREIINLKGSAEYKTKKSYKVETVVQMKPILENPFKFKADLVRSENIKRKRHKYKGSALLTSDFITLKLSSNLEKRGKGTVSSQFVLDYNLPKIKKERVTFSSKFIDRSTKTTKKYKINGNFDVKQNRDYNMLLDVGVNSNSRHNELEMKFRHGANVRDVKDKRKELHLLASVDHKVASSGATASIDYVVKVFYPPKDVNFHAKGHHSHDKKNLASSLSVSYGKKQNLETAFKLRDRTRNKMINLEGSFTLAYPGRDIAFVSNLTQKSRTKYLHITNLNLQKGQKSTLVTNFERPTSNSVELSSEAVIHGYEPVRFVGSANLNWKNLKLSGKVSRKGDAYGLTGESVVNTKQKNGKWKLVVDYLKKQVTVKANGGKHGDKYKAEFDAELNDETAAKSRYSGSVLFHNKGGANRRLGGSFEVRTPIENYARVAGDFDYSNDRKEVSVKGSAGYGHKQISATASMDKPFKVTNLGLSFAATTPFQRFEAIEINVINKFDNTLLSQVKYVVGPHNADMKFSAEYAVTTLKRDIQAGFVFKSSLRAYRSVSVSFEHSDDGHTYSKSKVKYNDNGDMYKAEFDMNAINTRINFNGNGNLILISPNNKIITTLHHEHRPYALSTTFNTDWGKGQKILVDVSAGYEKIVNTKVNSEVIIQTPWAPVNDVDVNLAYEQGTGYLKLNTLAKNNRQTLVLLDSNYRRNHGLAELDVSLTGSMLANDIMGKVNVNEYESNPKRGHAEFQWARAKKISMDVYLDLQPTIYSVDSSVRITTPFKGAENIVFKYKNKKRGKEWVSKVTLEYGLGMYITGETHLHMDNLRKFRVSIDSSFPEMQHFESGIEMSGSVNKNARLSADVEIRPLMRKMAAEVSWNLVRQLSGMIRLDTPFKQFRYLQVTGTHLTNTLGKTCHLKMEYHPSKVIVLNTTYHINAITDFALDSVLETPYPKYRKFEAELSFKKPGMAMEGRASLKTPFETYKVVSANFNHAMSRQNIQTHAEASYGPGKKIESDLYLNWNDGVDGSVTFRSPLKRLETIRVTINHHGTTWRDFTSKTQVQYANKRIEGDVSFRHGTKTTGSLLVKTPFQGFENINAKINREGRINDFKLKGILIYGTKSHEGALQFALKDDRFGIASVLKTPSLENMKLSYMMTGNWTDFSTKYEVAYGTAYKLDEAISFKVSSTDFSVRYDAGYTWQGESRLIGATAVKQGDINNFNVELGGKFNSKVMHAVTSFQRGRISRGNFRLTTPFKQYTDVGVSFDHTGDENRFSTNARFNIRDDMDYEARVENLKQGEKRIETTVELKTPHKGHEDYKLTYQHSLRKNRLVAEAEVYQNRRKTYSADANVAYTVPVTATLNIITPHEGYRSIKASGNYKKRNTRHTFSATANVGKHGAITAESTVDTSGAPYTGSATVNTPFTGYEQITMHFTHRGQHIRDFRTTVTANLPKMKTITCEASSLFRMGKDFNGLFTMSSGLKNMEDIRLLLRGSRTGDISELHSELGWQKSKVITTSSNFRFVNDMSGVELATGTSITTPFSQIATTNFKLDHMHNSEKVAERITFDYNGKSYLDADMDYTHGHRHEGSINIRTPRPMSMRVDGQYEVKQFHTDLFLNWNHDDLESNVKFETAYNDRTVNANVDTDLKFMVIHPVRTMGIETVVKKLPMQMQNKALITWDQKMGSTFAYDVQWNDRNSRYRQASDGSVLVVVPTRSVKVGGSYVNSTFGKSLDATVMWDAERDQTKQVAVKLDMDQRSKSVKRSVLVHLPSIKKDYKLETSMIRNQGNVLVDGTTIFTYSPDPRKALTLTTKMENLGASGYNNYSVSVGINHPSTSTNLLLNTHLGNTSMSCSGGLVLSYEARNRQKKYFVLKGDVNHKMKKMNIEASSPLKHVVLSGRMFKDIEYHFGLTNTYDHNKVVNTEIMVDTERKTLNLDFAYNSEDPNDSIHLSAGYVNDTAIQAEIYRKVSRQRIPESWIAVRLNSSHILHTRVTWRPSSLMELQQFVSSKALVYSYVMNEAASEVSQAMGQEVTAKYNRIANEIFNEMKPVFTLLEKEMANAKVNLDLVQREVRRAYRRNDLYIKDMGNAVNSAFNKMFGGFGNFVEEFERFYMKTERTLTQLLHTVKNYPITQKYMQFVDKLISDLKNFRQLSAAKMQMWTYQMDKASNELYKSYLTYTRSLQRKMKGFASSIMDHPKVKGIRATYANLKSQVASLPEVDYKQYGEILDGALQKALEPLALGEKYNVMKIKAKEAFESLNIHQDLKRAHHIANEIHQQFVWTYKYWDLDSNLRLTMLRLYEASRDMIFMEMNKLKDSLVDLDKSRVIVYDPLNGELQVELYLPVPLKSLAEAPDFNIRHYIRKVKNFVDRYIPGRNYSVWDTYYKFVPSVDSSTWMPPYRAYAAVVGNQHFITFDKNHFDFAGRCSYVLTRDMVDDNFTVVVNYDNNMRAPKKKSMLVMLRGINIEVGTNYKVLVNDQPVELPFTQGKVEAIRENYHITVDDGTGLTVEVDPVNDIYTIGLSGWYHGRVAGLLGTFDNENSNDMLSINRQKLTDVTDFANSWEVGHRSCRASNKATEISMANVDSIYPECVAYFKAQTSQFRPCFSVVPAEEFLHTCVGYVQTGATPTNASCRTAAQYTHLCRTHGVYLSVPTNCVSCALTSDLTSITSGMSVQLTAGDKEASLPSSADVILVLEEKNTQKLTATTLGDLITEVDSALGNVGINQNKYGLVGYGGPGRLEMEHSRTFDGHLFSHAKRFLRGVESIVYSDSKVAGDGLAAIRLATTYPFRTGVAKVILFIPASDCEANEAHVDMDGILTAHGFVMHVLRSKPMDIRDNRPVRNVQIYGMDQAQIFTMRSRRTRNEELFKKLVQPADRCSQLALNSNGSIFDSTHMQGGSSKNRREFVRNFASRVAMTAAPPVCQTCKCEQDATGMGKTVCKPCDQASFLWRYMPDWWSSNRTPVVRDVLTEQLKEYLGSVQRQVSLAA
ncbi:apolipophorins-like [Haliotis rufescens]|uniref:apolipophorins-like n=1 Tax=Haliotis rufescens TaxID=6454 RepID=UPI00201F351D|nr:apolipophorins-like [Haliotis rufescens]